MAPRAVQLQSFHLFRKLPAEIRREIYILASEPRVVHVKQKSEETIYEFMDRLDLLDPARGLNLDPELNHFAHNWSKSMISPMDVAVHEDHHAPTYLLNQTDLDPLINMDAEPTVGNINPYWLREQWEVAWWLLGKTRLSSTAPIPAFLHVSRESRYTLMNYGYTKAFGNSSHGPMTWFHFGRDILHLDLLKDCRPQKGLGFNILCHSDHNVGAIHPKDLLRVRRLSLAAPNLATGSLRRVANVLGLCGYKVEELFMAHWCLDREMERAVPDYKSWCMRNKSLVARGKAEHSAVTASQNATRRSARIEKRRTETTDRDNATEVARLVAKAVETRQTRAHKSEAPFITPCQDLDYVYSQIAHRLIRFNEDLTKVPWAFGQHFLRYWPLGFELGELPDTVCVEAFQRWRRQHATFEDTSVRSSVTAPATSASSDGNQDKGTETGGTSGSPSPPNLGNRLWETHDEFLRTMLAAYIGIPMPNASQDKENYRTALANETAFEASQHSSLLDKDYAETQSPYYQHRNDTEPFRISHPNWTHDISKRVLPVVKSVHIGTPSAVHHLQDCRSLCYDLMPDLAPGCEGKTGAERMQEFVVGTKKDSTQWPFGVDWQLDLRK